MTVTPLPKSTDPTSSGKFASSFFKRKIVAFVLWEVELLLKLKKRRAARWVLAKLLERAKPNRKMLALISRAWLGKNSNNRITGYRAEHLKNLMQRPIAQKDYPRVLYLCARYEALQKNLPVAAGDLIARQLVSEVGLKRIYEASKIALHSMPNSPYLIYLHSMTMAKQGEYSQASKLVSGRVEKVLQRKSNSRRDMQVTKKQFEMLRNSWRVVDTIAREDTNWLDEDRGGGYADQAAMDRQKREGATTQSWMLNFKEPHLQARDEDRYLELCKQEYDEGGTLIIKLKSIKEMLRQGARRQLTYHKAYQLAEACYDELRPELATFDEVSEADFMDAKQANVAVQTLGLAVDLCRELGHAEEIRHFKGVLVELSEWENFGDAKWLIPRVLVREEVELWKDVALDMVDTLPELPTNEGQLKAFLQWALYTREFERAEQVFDQLPMALKGSQASLFWINILQRQSRFTDAVHVIKRIHAYILAKPYVLNPYQHFSLLRRYGELNFLRETSNIYLQHKQPKNPQGVIIMGARNIDQLAKYPLIVLGELKRRGWAVVPLVEGLLPREMTGNADIDRLNGCITIELNFRPGTEQYFPEIEGFDTDATTAELRWGDIDLKNSVLEDARINRRAFNVDLTCPILLANTERLYDWTEHFGRAIQYAHDEFYTAPMRVGLMSLFNSRLPDSLFRFYCDHHGDPDKFFCLHTANGYENYFRNFTTNISTRCVIRNVTRYPHVRASSMPVPELFKCYYESNTHKLDDVLRDIEELSSIRRTTGDSKEVDPEAVACEEKIMQWREKGGKVACLFGRVVCDSAVPYDGGPAHKDLSDWLNHSIECVRGTDTLLLIKPHPHELNEQIGTYLNEYFIDLIKVDIPDNVIIMGHRWFDIQTLKRFVDLGVLFNGTTAIELALQEIPAVLCGHFGQIDYPVGHVTPKNRKHYANLLAFKSRSKFEEDMRARAALWLHYMSHSSLVLDYRYHSRPTTNKKIYPPYWISEDIQEYKKYDDSTVRLLARRAIGEFDEPSS